MKSNKDKAPVKKRSFSPQGRSFNHGKNMDPKGKTVYIGNLNYKIREKDLIGIFSKFGKVKFVNLLKNPGSDQSKGIAFVEMLKESDAFKAIETLNGKIMDGRTVKVSEAEENNPPTQKKFSPSFKKQNQENPQEKKEETERGSNKSDIIQKKKVRRRRGLNELFENTRKK